MLSPDYIKDLLPEDEREGARKKLNNILDKPKRAKITDWVLALGDTVGAMRETVHHTMDVLDRFHLALESPPAKEQLHVQVCAAFLIAAKMRENRPCPTTPGELQDFTCDDCLAGDISAEEKRMLLALDFQVRYLSPQEWVQIFITHTSRFGYILLQTRQQVSTILFLRDVSLHDTMYLHFSSGTLAAAALNLVCGVDLSKSCMGRIAADMGGCCKWMATFLPIALKLASPMNNSPKYRLCEGYPCDYTSCLNELAELGAGF